MHFYFFRCFLCRRIGLCARWPVQGERSQGWNTQRIWVVRCGGKRLHHHWWSATNFQWIGRELNRGRIEGFGFLIRHIISFFIGNDKRCGFEEEWPGGCPWIQNDYGEDIPLLTDFNFYFYSIWNFFKNKYF